MLALHRRTLFGTALALLLVISIYLLAGSLKAHLNLIDIFSEAGIALMLGLWLVMVLSSRPAGRVTRFLALGLAGLMLGAVADCCDEFVSVGKDQLWNHLLEGGLSLGGMLLLTQGLVYWRQEQFQLNAHLQKRERVFRNHRGFDQITQLADSAYLRQQIAHEQSQATAPMLAMLDIDDFHLLNRNHGHAAGDNVLRAVSHLLLLNLRQQDLLCRYAGDRFVILLPQMSAAQAESKCMQLCAAVASWRHHETDTPIRISMRHVCCPALGDADALLTQLSRQLDRQDDAVPLSNLVAG